MQLAPRSPGSIPLDDRWYGPLVGPRRRWVSQVLHRTASVSSTDPLGPRAGLGTALASGIAWTYGESVDRRALSVGCAALEVANHLVHDGWPEAVGSTSRDELLRLRGSARRLVQQREPLLRQMLGRALRGDVGRLPIPESVLFARGAVALGVVVGQVPDAIHETLDLVATWLGLGMEPTCNGLVWQGAFAALGVEAPVRSDTDRMRRAACAQLPPSALAEALEGLSAESSSSRVFVEWAPRRCPLAPSAGADDALEQALAEVVGEGPPAFRDAARFLQRAGGKRLRPRIVLAACEAVGGDPDEASRAAAAVEWLHVASLVLDDVMDGADLRRGLPTLHRATDTPFAVGVFFWLLDRVRRIAETLPPPVQVALRHAAEQLAEGQTDELAITADCSEADSHRVIAGKTAALFACAARVGAAMGGATPELQARLGRFGHEVGLAFQITDDLLDYTASESVFGKRPGTDLAAGKATLPFLLLRDRLEPSEREALVACLGSREGLPEVLAAMETHGIAERTRVRAARHVTRALDVLDGLDADGLVQLAEQITGRIR